jgi:hypothetical protein
LAKGLESHPKAEPRLQQGLDLEVCAGWASSFSRGLGGNHALLLSTKAWVWKAASSKVEPWRQQDWNLKCLQGGRALPLAVCAVALRLALTRARFAPHRRGAGAGSSPHGGSHTTSIQLTATHTARTQGAASAACIAPIPQPTRHTPPPREYTPSTLSLGAYWVQLKWFVTSCGGCGDRWVTAIKGSQPCVSPPRLASSSRVWPWLTHHAHGDRCHHMWRMQWRWR